MINWLFVKPLPKLDSPQNIQVVLVSNNELEITLDFLPNTTIDEISNLINGGNKLFGKLQVDSAKNAILPIIAATIMCDEECEIKENAKDSYTLENLNMYLYLIYQLNTFFL